MKRKHFNIWLISIFLILVNSLNAQEETLGIIPSKSSYAEKIYLQLSSTIFTADKTVWFKAIVTDVNHLPTKISGILHVELIDFDGSIIDKKMLKLKSGIADGFFQLNQAMRPGRYLIRAYTEWNKNFNTNFISKHYIDIYPLEKSSKTDEAIKNIVLTETELKQFELSAKVYPKLINPKHRGKLTLYIETATKIDSLELKKDKENGYSFSYKLPKNTVKAKLNFKANAIKLKNNNFDFSESYSRTIIVNKQHLDLQFFPEGGKLVDGLFSKVALKTVDYKNQGTVVSGTIVDQNDLIVTNFKSNSLGMGVTYLKADKQKIYYGIINDSNAVAYKYPLPKVYKKGYVLKANITEKYIRIAVKSNYSKQDSLYLKVQSRDATYHFKSLKLKDSLVNVAIEKKHLPEGIVKLTFLNKSKQPVCERLVFNYNEGTNVQIMANTHLKNYSQRDKTIIKLTTKDKDSNALPTNISVLVLNKEQLGDMHTKRQNILSYFLLNSELKGAIEKPAHYFDKQNASRYSDLDALMLTQGWRNYIFEDNKTNINFKIQPETSLVVSGTIGEYFNPKKRPEKPIELSFISFDKSNQIATQKVDSTGRFKFQLADAYTDKLEFLIQSENSKGKKKNYTINIDKKKAPTINFDAPERLQLADTINTYIVKNIERQQAEKAFEVANGTIALDEVVIDGYKLTPERQKNLDLHGAPDIVIEDKELHKKIKKWSYGLFSVLMFNYPSDIRVRRVGPNGGFLIAEAHSADFTFIIVDGKPVQIFNYNQIGNLPTEEIKSVEIVKSPKLPRQYVLEVFGNPRVLEGAIISFINIYTYSKKGLFGVSKTTGMYKNSMLGFAPNQEFYTPKHEALSTSDWNIPDLRSVVHWSPNITTDTNGNAKVEFYNDDNIGDVLVIVEGITPDGKIGYYEMTYSVSEKVEK